MAADAERPCAPGRCQAVGQAHVRPAKGRQAMAVATAAPTAYAKRMVTVGGASGGRPAGVEAVRGLSQAAAQGQRGLAESHDAPVARSLSPSHLPAPARVLRTSGAGRISAGLGWPLA